MYVGETADIDSSQQVGTRDFSDLQGITIQLNGGGWALLTKWLPSMQSISPLSPIFL